MSALGLTMHDLFEEQSSSRRVRTRPQGRRPSAGELHAALDAGARRYRERLGIDDNALLRTSELNAIRSAVAARYEVQLAPVPRPLHEGAYGGYERDPVWPVLFERALTVAAIELIGTPLEFGQPAPPAVLLRAEELAAADMHDIAREARRS